MKKRNIITIWIIVLLLPMALSLTACTTTSKVQAVDLMADIQPNDIRRDIDIQGEDFNIITDFALELFQQSVKEGENTLISPLSVIYALGMTANGAEGDTLSQMQDVFGLSIGKLNEYLYTYKNRLPSGDKYKLGIANSIWFKDDDGLVLNPNFLQINADWYNAALYKSPFDDSTLEDINSWVNENTDGMIKDIIDDIPTEAVMYLINAIVFDAEWQNIYKENQIREGMFTKEDSTEQKVDLMYSTEHQYLNDEKATGFIKYYADEKYAFLALLPREGVSIAEYTSSLTGERLNEILSNKKDTPVNAAIPKFKTEYKVEMSEILMSMGMVDAFNHDVSDFSGMGSSSIGNLGINQVLHKTFMAVDEKGTKAGAVTAVEIAPTSAIEQEQPQTVILDRPFVYMLMDSEVNLPIFIGALTEIEDSY